MSDHQTTPEPSKFDANGRRQHISAEDRAEWRRMIARSDNMWSRHTVRDLLDVLEATETALDQMEAAWDESRVKWATDLQAAYAQIEKLGGNVNVQ